MCRIRIIHTSLLLLAAAGATANAAEPVQASQKAARVEQPTTSKSATLQVAKADTGATAKDSKAAGDVHMSGMSVLGNEEAPKSLVIVPWKSSQLGNMPGISKLLDDSTQPVDKEVFLRELAYYQIKSGSK